MNFTTKFQQKSTMQMTEQNICFEIKCTMIIQGILNKIWIYFSANVEK